MQTYKKLITFTVAFFHNARKCYDSGCHPSLPLICSVGLCSIGRSITGSPISGCTCCHHNIIYIMMTASAAAYRATVVVCDRKSRLENYFRCPHLGTTFSLQEYIDFYVLKTNSLAVTSRNPQFYCNLRSKY